MRNIIIIGPPAAGKLTLAKELAARRGYFLFDNHRSIDAVTVLTADQTRIPNDLLHALRKTVLTMAAQANVPTIFTMVYDHPHDNEFMIQYEAALTNEEFPLIVQLHCTIEDSARRCSDESRIATSKITKAETILDVCKSHDLDTDYKPESTNVLHINTSREDVASALQRIEERL